jgi:hypothetical protein
MSLRALVRNRILVSGGRPRLGPIGDDAESLDPEELRASQTLAELGDAALL